MVPPRRALLLGLGLAATATAAADAALPSLAPPPPPPAFPRRTLTRPLAVLLLRSCYEGLDAMDVCPMDAWQARFWRSRADAWEPYIAARTAAGASPARPQQGEITDPAYFDYISWAQWGAVDAALVDAVATSRDGTTPFGFDEACDPETEAPCPYAGVRHVERGTPLPATLAGARAEFARAAGATALANLRAGFQGVSFDVPAVNPTDPASAQAALAQIAGVLEKNGYSLSTEVKIDASTSSLTLRCDDPADLYGVRRRLASGTPPNALAAVVGSALLDGVVEGLLSVTATDTATTATWKLRSM